MSHQKRCSCFSRNDSKLNSQNSFICNTEKSLKNRHVKCGGYFAKLYESYWEFIAAEGEIDEGICCMLLLLLLPDGIFDWLICANGSRFLMSCASHFFVLASSLRQSRKVESFNWSGRHDLRASLARGLSDRRK